VGALLGVLTSILTALFIILPNLPSSTTNRAEIRNIDLEPDVTFASYLQHEVIRRRLSSSKAQALRKLNSQLFPITGTAVDFDFEVAGYRGNRLSIRWDLFDATSHRRLAASEALDPLPLSVGFTKKDTDITSWEIWIDTIDVPGTRFVARIELYDEKVGARLTFKDTPDFPRPQGT
jgi:hypothetical protein